MRLLDDKQQVAACQAPSGGQSGQHARGIEAQRIQRASHVAIGDQFLPIFTSDCQKAHLAQGNHHHHQDRRLRDGKRQMRPDEHGDHERDKRQDIAQHLNLEDQPQERA